MSKIRPGLAIMLAVFVICLSACSESNDSDGIALQGDTGSSVAPFQDTSSTVESSLPVGSENISDDRSNETNRNGSNSVDDNGSGSGEKTSEQDSADNRNEDKSKSTEPEVIRPTVKESPTPRENDNAEVNFNDL